MDRKDTFLSPAEIVEDLLARLSDGGRQQMLRIAKREDMILFHHGVGTTVRNQYRLWDPANPHTEIHPTPNDDGVIVHPKFPDQVSHEILMKLWDRVHANA